MYTQNELYELNRTKIESTIKIVKSRYKKSLFPWEYEEVDQTIRFEIYKSLERYSEDNKSSVNTWIITNAQYGILRYFRSRKLVKDFEKIQEPYYELDLDKENILENIFNHSESCKKFFIYYLECDSNLSSLAKKFNVSIRIARRAYLQYKYMLTHGTNRLIRSNRVKFKMLKNLTHLNDSEAAIFLCVAHETVNRWRNRYPQFKKPVQFNRNNIEKVLKGDLERKDLGISSRKWAYWKWRYYNNPPKRPNSLN